MADLYYSKQIEMPTTRLQGLLNNVQMIINQAEQGDAREALLIAVDLWDTLQGQSNPFSSITAEKDSRLHSELARQHQEAMSAAIIKAHADGFDEGMRVERARIAALLGIAAK